MSKAAKLKGEVATLVVQAASQSGDGEGLAGGAAHENVNWACGGRLGAELVTGHISIVGCVGVVVCQHGGREFLNLGKPGGRPAQRVPGGGGGFDAAAYRSVFHMRVAVGLSGTSGRFSKRTTSPSAMPPWWRVGLARICSCMAAKYSRLFSSGSHSPL